MPIDYGIQVPQVTPVQQPNVLAQLQTMGLLRQIQQQNAMRSILGQSGGQIDDNTLAALYGSGNYEAANAIGNVRRQNMLLDLRRDETRLGMEATRLGMDQTRAQITGVNEENRARRVKANEAETDAAARKDVLDFIAGGDNSPEALDALRKNKPQAYMTVQRQLAEFNEIKARAQKEGFLSLEARARLAGTTADLLSPLLPSVTDQKGYSTIYERISALDPSVPGVIGPEYTPQNMRALGVRLQDLKDIEYKEDAFGRLYSINKRTGEQRMLSPLPKPEGQPYGAMPPKQQAEALSADIQTRAAAEREAARVRAENSKDSIVTIDNVPYRRPPNSAIVEELGVRPFGADTAQGAGAVAAAAQAAKDDREVRQAARTTTAQETAKAGVRNTEEQKKLRTQITQTVKELDAAAAPGGLIAQSTGSGVGTLADRAAGFVGVATSGAVAAGKLGPIADMALKLVPRFEGPQSDKDTQSYKEAAGRLADTSLPVKIRQEAAKEVARIMRERMDQFDAPADAASAKNAARAPSAQDEAALRWANANPNDPRAAEIKKMLGAP